MFKRMNLLAIGLCASAALGEAGSLPVGSTSPPAIEAPHFPSRLHTFVWRNWESVNLDRMAATIGATPDQIAEIGASMGLPPHQSIGEDQLARNYISVIRRNWHLLPYDQLLTLLGWDAEKLAYALKEDDFLWIKLGLLKPACAELTYAAPDAAVLARCAEIKSLVQERFGAGLAEPAEPRFAFVRELSAPMPDSPDRKPPQAAGADEPIRFIYSYFALYGDPLTDTTLDPYPDGLLERLRAVGVNGVWMHVVLRQLAPSREFPEFGKGWQTRLANLRKLVERAGRHGVKIYLYMNEPRAMPASFFEKRPELKGAPENDFYCMCTSSPKVRQWVTDALRHVFTEVPGLGGVFTISASENLTHCWSRGSVQHCPRCSQRKPADVIAEINNAIADGVRAGDPKAKVIIWDWAWPNEQCPDIIAQLPKDAYFMSVSEWDLPINRGGVPTTVGEYSMSAVGPGPRAKRNWELARKAGLKTMAKRQVNCTWELSAVPYIPAMNLVAQHCAGLVDCHVDGSMLSWTLGGCPSPNLELVHMFSRRPAPTVEDALRELAVRRYGEKAAADAVKAWELFSKGFAEFPYHGTFLYAGPMQMGPGNLLYATPTGYPATMVGFPYDDLNGWRAVYPAEVLLKQIEAVHASWRAGCEAFASVVADSVDASVAAEDAVVAEAVRLHFKSVANQIRFIMARDAARAEKDGTEGERFRQQMKELARSEIDVATAMFAICREDSRIGYEASNHYYYYPLDMIEKVVNCTYIMNH